jgi:ribonuclease VapC
MVLDTSALVAILQEEPERRRFLEVIAAAASVSMSTATFVEASTVLEARFGAEALVHLDRFLERAGVELIPVDLDQAREARDAFSRFGKGDMPPGWTTATASRTRWRARAVSGCCSRATTSPTPMSNR